MSDREGGAADSEPPGGDSGARGSGPLDFEPDAPPDKWAHRRDPDLETTPGRPAGAAPAPPRPRNPYSWIFALVVAVVLVYIGLNTLRNVGSVSRGVPAGKRLPPFAAPLAAGRLEGDANVATSGGQGEQGKRAACEVRGAEILNGCQLTEGAPAVLAFVVTQEPACAAQLDRLDRARARFPRVRFAAMALATDRARLRAEIRRRGWRLPIGYDRDRAVFSLYGIVDCPTIVFAYPGGVAMRSTFRPLTDRQLDAAVGRLMQASRRRGWKAPAPA